MSGDERDHGGNLCRIGADGPLHLTGRIRIERPDGAAEDTDEAFLCRCGASREKPYCDDSHHGAGFTDPGVIQGGRLVPVAGTDAGSDGSVTIVCAADGPLLVRGPLTVVGEDGGTSRGHKGALCRCGESSAKPFCDGTHRGCGFTA